MEVVPAPTIDKIDRPNFNIESMKLLKEYSKKGKENQEDFKIILGIYENSFIIKINKGINNFIGQFNLNELQLQDKYFKMFDTIEEAYKELLPYFNEEQYSLKEIDNNLALNIQIEHSHKKNSISFVLKKELPKKDDLINSLYMIVMDYSKENSVLKNDINILTTKVNQMEEKLNSIGKKIDLILSYINDKNKTENNKPFNNQNQISPLSNNPMIMNNNHVMTNNNPMMMNNNTMMMNNNPMMTNNNPMMMNYNPMMTNNNPMMMNNNPMMMNSDSQKSFFTISFLYIDEEKGRNIKVVCAANRYMTVNQLINNFRIKLCDEDIIIKRYLLNDQIILDPNSNRKLAEYEMDEKSIIKAIV